MTNSQTKDIEKILDKMMEDISSIQEDMNNWKKAEEVSLSIKRSTQSLLQLIKEEKIKEWQPLLTAEINHSGSPAPFNPEGLPINTPATQEMTKLLQGYAKDRIKELKESK